jgi:hypothetical protein
VLLHLCSSLRYSAPSINVAPEKKGVKTQPMAISLVETFTQLTLSNSTASCHHQKYLRCQPGHWDQHHEHLAELAVKISVPSSNKSKHIEGAIYKPAAIAATKLENEALSAPAVGVISNGGSGPDLGAPSGFDLKTVSGSKP